MTVCTTCQHANNYNNAFLYMGENVHKVMFSLRLLGPWRPEPFVYFLPFLHFKLTAGKKMNYSSYSLRINRGMGTKPKPYSLQLKKYQKLFWQPIRKNAQVMIWIGFDTKKIVGHHGYVWMWFFIYAKIFKLPLENHQKYPQLIQKKPRFNFNSEMYMCA